MIVYEVNLRVEREIADAYLTWLHEHLRHMLTLPGFLGAELFEVDSGGDTTERTYCAQYRLHDAAALDAYLHEHAPQMRAEGTQRFGTKFSAQRRVLRPLATA